MYPNHQVRRPIGGNLVVYINMHIEQLLSVNAGGFHSFNHHVRAVECESWIVKLDAPAPKVIQVLDFLSENLDKVGKILRWSSNACPLEL